MAKGRESNREIALARYEDFYQKMGYDLEQMKAVLSRAKNKGLSDAAFGTVSKGKRIPVKQLEVEIKQIQKALNPENRNLKQDFKTRKQRMDEAGGFGSLDKLSIDPAMQAMAPDQPASELEEVQAQEAVVNMMEFLQEPQHRESVLTMVKNSSEKFQGMSDAAFLLAKREWDRATGENGEAVNASVMLGDGAVLQSALDLVHSLAVKAGIVSQKDDDQYAAALMNVYAKAGEAIEAEGDVGGQDEAQEMLLDMGLTNSDGSKVPMPNVLSQSINRGLLG